MRQTFASIEDRFDYIKTIIPEQQIDRYSVASAFGITAASASNVMSQLRKAGLVEIKKSRRPSPIEATALFNKDTSEQPGTQIKPVFAFPDKVTWNLTKVNEDRARHQAGVMSCSLTSQGGWKG